LQRTLEILKDLDKKKIFHEPVDLNEVPTYSDVIHNPMDFSKMQSKINRMEYITFSQFEADFDLIINNCLLFNQKNSFYYKTAFKLREQVSVL
jgi:bromodomain and PHD finger-containing protein 1